MSGLGSPPRLAAVTGASGFIGRTLCERLLAGGVVVRALTRDARSALPPGCERRAIGDIAHPDVPWAQALAGVDVVFHLAAIAHAPGTELQRLRAVNVDATQAIARATFALGARLVHLSSIKANCESSPTPIDEHSPLCPTEPYGVSKRDAEQAIALAAAEIGGRWIALRPPLVHGPGCGANFERLVRVALSGLPLPLAAVRNRRSMVHVGNLADALVRAASLPALPDRSFVFADSPALAIGEWLRLIARAAGRTPRLWPMPRAGLRVAAALVGGSSTARQLLDSLETDGRAWCALGPWQAPLGQAEAVADSVRALRI